METCKSCVGTGSGEALGDRNCKEEHFLYFAYGSNLLRERIMLRNPSAAFHAIANLQVGTEFAFLLSVCAKGTLAMSAGTAIYRKMHGRLGLKLKSCFAYFTLPAGFGQ